MARPGMTLLALLFVVGCGSKEALLPPDAAVQGDLDASVALPDLPAADLQSHNPTDLARGDGGPSTAPIKLWVLNQNGDPALEDFFNCLLDDTNWNDLATAYPDARPMRLGGFVNVMPSGGQYPCTVNQGSQPYYQCAVDAGHFDVADDDVLLVVRPDGKSGGLDNSFSTDPTHGMMVVNPISKATVTMSTAHVGNATSTSSDYYFGFASHEVFEAQTDLLSADCCDGETASGGPINICPNCGPYPGQCGAYYNQNYGIRSLTCPNGKSYPFESVSPPGAHVYGSPEFNGTCMSFVWRPTPAPGWSCNDSVSTGGQQRWTCGSDGSIYECQNDNPVKMVCRHGCTAHPDAGTANDTCN